MPEVWSVDRRWDGLHGIGRYANEVTPRLSVATRDSGLRGNPAHAASLLQRPYIRATAAEGFYSPGYAGLLSSVRQVLTLHDLIHLQASPPSLRFRAYYNAIIKPILLRNRVVVTVSETSAKQIADWLGSAGSRVEIANCGNGCSPAFVEEGPRYEPRRPYFMYVGNTKPHKNFHLILDGNQFNGKTDGPLFI